MYLFEFIDTSSISWIKYEYFKFSINFFSFSIAIEYKISKLRNFSHSLLYSNLTIGLKTKKLEDLINYPNFATIKLKSKLKIKLLSSYVFCWFSALILQVLCSS